MTQEQKDLLQNWKIFQHAYENQVGLTEQEYIDRLIQAVREDQKEKDIEIVKKYCICKLDSRCKSHTIWNMINNQ